MEHDGAGEGGNGRVRAGQDIRGVAGQKKLGRELRDRR